jgi:undecaprenyl diphosphate synthase
MKSLEERKAEILNNSPKLAEIPEDKFPQHIFIIPDGNRRYAKNNGKPIVWGHQKGFKVAIELLRYFRPLPIRAVTLWGFASDNWKRSDQEVKHLMRIYGLIIDKYLDELMENDSRFIHLGRRDRIPAWLLDKFEMAEEKTKNNKGQIICLAVDFGGEDQNVRTANEAIRVNKEVTQENIWELRDGKGIVKSADLIFRPSEIRTSDVGWINGSHSVLYFLKDKLFPQVTVDDLADAIYFYSQAKKNEGK